MTLPAITIWQPWADHIACGRKRFETRSWPTAYRGLIAIHSGRKKFVGQPPNLPLGCIVAVAEIVACHEMTPEFMAQQSDAELLLGDWQQGRYAWELANVCKLLIPLPVLGKQGLWRLPEGTLPDWE